MKPSVSCAVLHYEEVVMQCEIAGCELPTTDRPERETKVTNLFQLGSFTLHSGDTASWKIECDALTQEDWRALAAIISERVDFRDVMGVPSGGMALAKELQSYRKASPSLPVLVVDDVLTTGNSMEALRKAIGHNEVKGFVVFARGQCPEWVTPLFQLTG